jgi:signal transduction histidine kinase/ActR/RegA family two-component response regulator
MAEADWHSLETVVLTGTVESLREARLPASAAAFVVDCAEPHAALAALLPRTNAPIVLLSDTDLTGAARLVAAGADDVLARRAPFSDVMRAARHAAARRTRQPREPQAGGSVVEHTEPPAIPDDVPVPEGDSARVAVDPRDGGPKDMPPQLQAVGRLAGGVAHDFNNLLQVIGGSAEELVHGLEVSDRRRAAAQAIVDAASRAATLTHQLLAFGRRQTLIASSIDASALVTEALAHLRGRVGTHITIATALSPGLPRVHADKSQLLEVLSNLADNAAEAMPDGGTLSISTGVVEVDEPMRVARPWLKPGRFVQIQVADTGAGIDAEALPHLFEPFFSTTKRWGGTGLGLSSVYGIIKQSGGFIWVESQIDHGTRITILLPAIGDVVEQAPATSAATSHVLLVEDDEGVRDLLVGVLTHYGYAVAAYGSAEDALTHTGRFDLLLTDVLLPGMNGPDLAREIRATYPGVPVLMMSGDTGHVVDPTDLDARGFLQKPFSARTLVTRVEELIAGAKAKERPSSDR